MMKKRGIIGLAAALVLAGTGVVFYAAATEDEAWKENVGSIDLDAMSVSGQGAAIEGDTVSITQGGDFTVTGTLADGMIYVNTDQRVKLRLSGASITNSKGPAIFFDNVDKGFITLTENTENFLSDGKEYTVEDADAALFSNDDLEIKGDGTLTVTGNYQHGIASDDDLTIENGNIRIQSYEHGIKANDDLTVTGGDIAVTSETGKGMKADLSVTIDGGRIDIISQQSEGIESKGTLTVNGGDIHITAADDGINTGNADSGQTQEAGMQPGERFRGGQPPAEGETPPQAPEGAPMGGPRTDALGDGGTPQGPAPDGTQPQGWHQRPMNQDGTQFSGGGRGMGGGFGPVDEATAAAHAITINGGNLTICAEGDGIDSNGSLTINGGTVVIDGPSRSGNGPLDSQGAMTMNGGTLLTASAAGMLQNPTLGEGIRLIQTGFSQVQTANTLLAVKTGDGAGELASMTPTKNFQVMTYASGELKVGQEIAVYVDGTRYEGCTVAEGVNNIGSVGMGGFGGHGSGGMGGRRPFSDEIRVMVDGRPVRFDTPPVLKNDTTLVGFRGILEALGATVGWEEETQTVTAARDGIDVVLRIGSETATVNGEEKQLLLAPEIINDSTMIPLRFVSEALGMQVEWNDAMQMAVISSQQ